MISSYFRDCIACDGFVYFWLFEVICALIVLHLIFKIYTDYKVLQKLLLEQMLFSALQSYDRNRK